MTADSKTPAFLIERIKREIESANNPVGMSVHDGRTRILASDAQYMLNRIASLQDELAAEKAGHEAWQQSTDAKLLADTIARYLRQLGPHQLGREGAVLLFKAEIALRTRDNP